MLAVKPQNLADVAAELKGKLNPGQLVLSIIAGKNIKSLQQGLGHKSVVRVMPNTPAQIGMGMSVWTATAEVTQPQKVQVGSMLGAMGEEIYVEDESVIDMATAISGSGPAYVFLFMESLVNAAADIGLPADTARKLVLQTVLGSAKYARQSGEELARLRQMVTSPGGTTAEAIAVFETKEFRSIIKQAVEAAYKKTKQLGG
jgi:pyrroline-5-carboxylate reductase